VILVIVSDLELRPESHENTFNTFNFLLVGDKILNLSPKSDKCDIPTEEDAQKMVHEHGKVYVTDSFRHN
jgi:hypothetical protein